MLDRHLSGAAIADTSDFGPKPWISLATVIWRMEPILVHLSSVYRAWINPMHVCVDSRCGTQPVSNPPVRTIRESGILAAAENTDHRLHDPPQAGARAWPVGNGRRQRAGQHPRALAMLPDGPRGPGMAPRCPLGRCPGRPARAPAWGGSCSLWSVFSAAARIPDSRDVHTGGLDTGRGPHLKSTHKL